MVDLSGQDFERWRGRESSSRPVAVALFVVAFTAVAALIAWRAIAYELTSVSTLWLVLGLVAAWALFRRLFAAYRLGTTLGSVSPAVMRRDGTVVSADARRYRRSVPARRSTMLHLRNGRSIAARIVDISIAGVAVEARMSDMDFMGVVRVGARDAGPVRRTPQGAVFGFDTLLDPQPFDATFVL